MRKLLSLMAAATLVASLGLATTASAAVVEWSGTLIVNVGTPPQFEHLGTGVATINGTAGGPHINTISIPSGLTFTGGNSVPEIIPLTDPDNPELISLRGTGMRIGQRTTGGSDITAVWNGISGGPPLGTKNTGRPPGNMKMCLLVPGCTNLYLPIDFGTVSNTNAVGIGGLFTVNTFDQDPNGFKLSIYGSPWTIGIASIKNVTTETANGGFTTYTKTLQGFAHGPVSGTSNTASISGVLQIVSPVFIETSLGQPDTFQAVWVEVRLHFIPEPGLLLLLGSGVAGLLMLGRHRMRK